MYTKLLLIILFYGNKLEKKNIQVFLPFPTACSQQPPSQFQALPPLTFSAGRCPG